MHASKDAILNVTDLIPTEKSSGKKNTKQTNNKQKQ